MPKSFIPIDDIHDGIMYIHDNTAPGAEYLVDYFDQTYVISTFRRTGDPRDGLDGAAIVRIDDDWCFTATFVHMVG